MKEMGQEHDAIEKYEEENKHDMNRSRDASPAWI